MQTLSGAVTFVDALDATGFAGTNGSQNVYATAAQAASPIESSGTLSDFMVNTGTAASSGAVVLTVLKNGSPTPITCTIPSGASSCSDSTHTAAVTPSATIAVEIQNSSGNFVRNVAWAAQLG